MKVMKVMKNKTISFYIDSDIKENFNQACRKLGIKIAHAQRLLIEPILIQFIKDVKNKEIKDFTEINKIIKK